MVTQTVLVKQWIAEQRDVYEHLLTYIEEEMCAGVGVEVRLGVTMLSIYAVQVQNYKNKHSSSGQPCEKTMM